MWLAAWVGLWLPVRHPTRPTQAASDMLTAVSCCNLVFWCSGPVSCAEVLQALVWAVWLAAWVGLWLPVCHPTNPTQAASADRADEPGQHVLWLFFLRAAHSHAVAPTMTLAGAACVAHSCAGRR
jgi:hypothetical protein